MAKTKNVYTRYLEQQAAREIKTDGTETAAEMLPPQAKGEKRKYNRKSPTNRRLKEWEHRNKVISVWLTETEYNAYVEMAKRSGAKTYSDFLRKIINERTKAFKGE